MSRSIIDLVQTTFESDLRDAAEALRSGGADDRLQQLYRAWPAWASEWPAPALARGELRPFACSNWSGHDASGLASAWMDLAGRAGHGLRLEQHLTRHLLFCDSVALPDPFVYSPDGETLVRRAAGGIRDLPACRSWAAEAIECMARLQELIARDVIVIAPCPLKPFGLDPAAAQAVDASLAGEFPRKPADYWGLGEHQIVAMDIALQMVAAGGAMEPYLATPGHAAVFRTLVRSTDETIRAATHDSRPGRYDVLVPRLLTSKVLEPADVTLADVMAIRRHGEFDGWRAAVAEGVRSYVDRVGDDGRWESTELLREEIAEAVDREADRVKRSLGWSRSRDLEVGFDVALVGGAVASEFLNPILAAGAASLMGARLLAVEFVRWRFARGTLARHVAVFRSAE
jgi:hypothetical protein